MKQPFISDNNLPEQEDKYITKSKLFNFANLSNRTIINIFAKIFPQLCKDRYIMNLNIKLTFFEFFEAFLECADESVNVTVEDSKLKNRISVGLAPHSSPIDLRSKMF